MPDRKRWIAGAPSARAGSEDEAREQLLGATLDWAPMPVLCSVRWRRSAADGFLATPAPGAQRLASLDDIGWCALDGGGTENAFRPAAGHPGWRLHQALYRRSEGRRAIVVSRPAYCATLACLAQSGQEAIPAFHPDVAQAAAGPIACVALRGDDDAAIEQVVVALADRPACLLAGYGLLVTGASLDEVRWRTSEIESLAAIYWRMIVARQAR